MIRTRLAYVAALAAALSVTSAGPSSAAAVADQDVMFVKAAHQGNLAEIAAGQDAQKNATTACVKEVGTMLVRDHTKLDADVRTLADKLDIALPAGPTEEQKRELAAVQAKAGSSAYDKAWLTLQEAAHTKTLALIDQELRDGRNAEVKAAARAARPVVAMHLDMVRGGVCHAAKEADTVKAGSGGQLAAQDEGMSAAGVAGLLGGGVLTVAGAAWLVHNRRRSAHRS
ncbi:MULTISPECIES: DUF4142 domain-containing protein [Streptomyces]|uniref:DUF4142 domain-containing protein n=2 Tax=Streptomyces chilikensis TaxID=1194079 RepID=A0ABV3EJK0_9ACTN|nr:DUF4142 domain-containing protein [Streptomyces sp. MJP52]MDH6226366.1 putative membrane protein [Streptomyces sp. MJP52]